MLQAQIRNQYSCICRIMPFMEHPSLKTVSPQAFITKPSTTSRRNSKQCNAERWSLSLGPHEPTLQDAVLTMPTNSLAVGGCERGMGANATNHESEASRPMHRKSKCPKVLFHRIPASGPRIPITLKPTELLPLRAAPHRIFSNP